MGSAARRKQAHDRRSHGSFSWSPKPSQPPRVAAVRLPSHRNRIESGAGTVGLLGEVPAGDCNKVPFEPVQAIE
jgi:hypothetical protein